MFWYTIQYRFPTFVRSKFTETYLLHGLKQGCDLIVASTQNYKRGHRCIACFWRHLGSFVPQRFENRQGIYIFIYIPGILYVVGQAARNTNIHSFVSLSRGCTGPVQVVSTILCASIGQVLPEPGQLLKLVDYGGGGIYAPPIHLRLRLQTDKERETFPRQQQQQKHLGYVVDCSCGNGAVNSARSKTATGRTRGCGAFRNATVV